MAGSQDQIKGTTEFFRHEPNLIHQNVQLKTGYHSNEGYDEGKNSKERGQETSDLWREQKDRAQKDKRYLLWILEIHPVTNGECSVTSSEG